MRECCIQNDISLQIQSSEKIYMTLLAVKGDLCRRVYCQGLANADANEIVDDRRSR